MIEDADLVAILKDVSGEDGFETSTTTNTGTSTTISTSSSAASDATNSNVQYLSATCDKSTAKGVTKNKHKDDSSGVKVALPKTSFHHDNNVIQTKQQSKQTATAPPAASTSASAKKSHHKKKPTNYQPILPAIQPHSSTTGTGSDQVDLYFHSTASNVSPDSGIQSEGGNGHLASSSPMSSSETITGLQPIFTTYAPTASTAGKLHNKIT